MASPASKRSRSERFEEDALLEILAIERQAQGIVRDAEAEAQRILATAQQQAQDMRAAAEREIDQQAAETLRRALMEIDQQTRDIQEQAEREAEVWLRVAGRHYAEIAALALRVITLAPDAAQDG